MRRSENATDRQIGPKFAEPHQRGSVADAGNEGQVGAKQARKVGLHVAPWPRLRRRFRVHLRGPIGSVAVTLASGCTLSSAKQLPLPSTASSRSAIAVLSLANWVVHLRGTTAAYARPQTVWLSPLPGCRELRAGVPARSRRGRLGGGQTAGVSAARGPSQSHGRTIRKRPPARTAPDMPATATQHSTKATPATTRPRNRGAEHIFPPGPLPGRCGGGGHPSGVPAALRLSFSALWFASHRAFTVTGKAVGDEADGRIGPGRGGRARLRRAFRHRRPGGRPERAPTWGRCRSALSRRREGGRPLSQSGSATLVSVA